MYALTSLWEENSRVQPGRLAGLVM
ncbi:TPA_asm: UL5.5 iORF 3 [Human alphaherpesvirus 1]|nr:TPA_asm: UL5.5 iORF 3 [Human alphaherpesvirus 1]